MWPESQRFATTRRHKAAGLLLTILVLICIALTGSPASAAELRLRYLGAAGWEMRSGDTVVLVDPYISRVPYGSVQGKPGQKVYGMSDELQPDTALIDRIIERADYILVQHAHPDHIFDVPYIARKTGAKVLASASASSILRAAGVPESQIYTIVGGEDYQFGDLSIRVLPSLHSALDGKQYFDPRQHPDKLEGPITLSHLIEGGSFMYLCRFEGHEVLTMGSMNFIEREIQGLTPDVLLAGAGSSRTEIYRYTERLLAGTGHPGIVFATHWDNFFVPYDDEAALASSRQEKAEPFVAEAREASPGSSIRIPRHLEWISIEQPHKD